MAQVPDPIDQILSDLEQDLSNCLTMLRIAIQLRRNSAHLMTLLRSMLGELSADIHTKALPILPAAESERR